MKCGVQLICGPKTNTLYTVCISLYIDIRDRIVIMNNIHNLKQQVTCNVEDMFSRQRVFIPYKICY